MKQQPPRPPPGDDAAAANPSPSSGTQLAHPRISNPQSAPEGSKEKDISVDFILDTVASVHATACADLLSDPRPLDSGAGVRFPTRAGEDYPVDAVGTIVTPDFVLAGVRLVPRLGRRRTLVSVRQLVDHGLTVSFGRDACEIKEEPKRTPTSSWARLDGGRTASFTLPASGSHKSEAFRLPKASSSLRHGRASMKR